MLAAQAGKVEGLHGLRTFGLEAIDPAGRLIPIVLWAEVAQANIAPIRNVDRSIRSNPGIHRPEPAASRQYDGIGVLGAERGSVFDQAAGLHSIGQRHSCDHLTFVMGQCASFVDHQGLREPRLVARVGHVLKETESVWIGQWAVFGPVFNVVASLNKVETPGRPNIGSNKDASLTVEIKGPGISTAFRKQLECFGHGVVAPDCLAQKFDSFHMTGRGTALHPIKPTVWAPVQIVSHRMSIFEAEAGKADFRVAVRHIILIAVRIEQQVRWIQNENPTATHRNAGGNVQTSDKILVRLEPAVSVAVLQNRDLVGAANMMGRWQRDLVKDCAQVFVVLHDLESSRERVLNVLHHPEATSLIEVEI